MHIQVHIRRGDKWREAEPTNDTAYDLAAQNLYNGCKAGFCEPPLKREIFLSTEDPSAVDYFVNNTDWAVRYVDNPALFKPDGSVWTHVSTPKRWEIP